MQSSFVRENDNGSCLRFCTPTVLAFSAIEHPRTQMKARFQLAQLMTNSFDASGKLERKSHALMKAPSGLAAAFSTIEI